MTHDANAIWSIRLGRIALWRALLALPASVVSFAATRILVEAVWLPRQPEVTFDSGVQWVLLAVDLLGFPIHLSSHLVALVAVPLVVLRVSWLRRPDRRPDSLLAWLLVVAVPIQIVIGVVAWGPPVGWLMPSCTAPAVVASTVALVILHARIQREIQPPATAPLPPEAPLR